MPHADDETYDTKDVDLHPEHISCPHCGADSFRVDHAPHYNDQLYYCTDCPRRAEVTFDDLVYARIVADAGAHGDSDRVRRGVEDLLRACECGGRFRSDAPRRCSDCGGVVLAGEPGVDLWPGYCDFDVQQHTPPPELVERINAFDAEYIRRANLWQR